MASLVEQMQREAIDQSIPVSQLLRRAKLAAFKLQLKPSLAWVDHELDGYRGVMLADLPNYRLIRGAPVVQNPVRGVMMPIVAPPEILNQIGEMPVTQSIASLEELCRGEGNLFFRFDPDLTERLNSRMDIALPVMGLQVHPSVIRGLIDGVRSSILDWAMALEAKGIVGSEINFSTDEKRRAATMTINIGQMSGNLNAGDVTGAGARLNQGSTDNSVNTISPIFAEIETALEGIDDAGQRDELIALTRAMKVSQGKPEYLANYQKFVAAAANHMTVLAPFLPALTVLLGS